MPVEDMNLQKPAEMLCGKLSPKSPFHCLQFTNTTSFRAAGAVAVTVPSCWYLLSNGPDTSHGHGDHGDSHGKEHEEEHEEESKDEDSEGKSEEKPEEKSEDKSEEGDDKADDGDSEKSEDSDSGEEDKGADTPDISDDEGDSEKSSDDKNTRKSVPDAKGGSKARKESNQAVKAGEVDNQVRNGNCPCNLFVANRCRLPHLARTVASRKDSPTPIQSTPPILPTIVARALKEKVSQKQQSQKAQ
jgi:hypothetical protein